MTSDIQGAGTDANVYMKIYGELRKSAEIKLNKSKTHMNKFEKGHTDLFNIKEEYFGDIKQIKYVCGSILLFVVLFENKFCNCVLKRIGHDNAGVAPGWHLKEVIIESIEADKKWIFPCNQWLDKENGDGKIEIKLTPLDFHDLNAKSKLKAHIIISGKLSNRHVRFMNNIKKRDTKWKCSRAMRKKPELMPKSF